MLSLLTARIMLCYQGKVETACAAVLTAMLPSAMYAGIHWDAMTQSMHMWSLLLLTSGPLLAVLSSPGGIWWSGLNARAASLSRWTCTLICLGAFVAGVEVRPVLKICCAELHPASLHGTA